MGDGEEKNYLKMNERRGNVYENKGPAFSSLSQSGNVVENKDSYALKPGILLKTGMLSVGIIEMTLCQLSTMGYLAHFSQTLDFQFDVEAAEPVPTRSGRRHVVRQLTDKLAATTLFRHAADRRFQKSERS